MFSVNPPSPLGIYVMQSDANLGLLKSLTRRKYRLGFPLAEAISLAEIEAKCEVTDLTDADQRRFENFLAELTY